MKGRPWSGEYSPCGRCGRTTPVSVNTDLPEGFRCLECQRGGDDRRGLEGRIRERLNEIAVEERNLLAKLVEVENAC